MRGDAMEDSVWGHDKVEANFKTDYSTDETLEGLDEGRYVQR